jgi:hypothetical protein
MKKGPLVAIIGGIILVAGVVGIFILGKDTGNTADSNNAPTTSYKALDACSLFTEQEAKTVLGSAATKGSDTVPSSTADINVSSCTYTNNAGVVSDIRVTTVLIRSALSDQGADSNKNAFNTGRPAGVEAVNGYGSDAYWNPAAGQLNILKDDAWMIINTGASLPTQRTLADTKVVAALVVK